MNRKVYITCKGNLIRNVVKFDVFRIIQLGRFSAGCVIFLCLLEQYRHDK